MGSGQRAMIAIARACQSDLLVADGPTTALHVTSLTQVRLILCNRPAESAPSIISVSHDWRVVSRTIDRVAG